MLIEILLLSSLILLFPFIWIKNEHEHEVKKELSPRSTCLFLSLLVVSFVYVLYKFFGITALDYASEIFVVFISMVVLGRILTSLESNSNENPKRRKKREYCDLVEHKTTEKVDFEDSWRVLIGLSLLAFLLYIFYVQLKFIMALRFVVLLLIGLWIFSVFFLNIFSLERKGKANLGFFLLLLLLYGFFHSFLMYGFGEKHYIVLYENLRAIDWVQFIVAHVIRAADILDIVEEYGISLQAIKHKSLISGLALVAMHWMVDLLLIIILFKSRIMLNFKKEDNTQKRVFDFCFFWYGLFLLFVILWVSLSENWSLANLGLWLLENVIKTYDMGDTFQIFNLKIHELDSNLINSCLAICLRLFLVVWASRYVEKLLARLVIIPRTKDQLIELLEDNDLAIKRNAIKSLAQIESFEDDRAIPKIVSFLEDPASQEYSLQIIGRLALYEPKISEFINGTSSKDAEYLLEKWQSIKDNISKLENLLYSKNHKVSNEAIQTLSKIQSRRSIPLIVNYLDNLIYELKISMYEISRGKRYSDKVGEMVEKIKTCMAAIKHLKAREAKTTLSKLKEIDYKGLKYYCISVLVDLGEIEISEIVECFIDINTPENVRIKFKKILEDRGSSVLSDLLKGFDHPNVSSSELCNFILSIEGSFPYVLDKLFEVLDSSEKSAQKELSSKELKISQSLCHIMISICQKEEKYLHEFITSICQIFGEKKYKNLKEGFLNIIVNCALSLEFKVIIPSLIKALNSQIDEHQKGCIKLLSEMYIRLGNSRFYGDQYRSTFEDFEFVLNRIALHLNCDKLKHEVKSIWISDIFTKY